MPEPHTYTRRLLLAVTGLSPQIVTETLYALCLQQEPPFVPTEVHLITTREGAKLARRSLLGDSSAAFHRFARDYGFPDIAFPETNIRILSDADGHQLDDIRSLADNRRASDLITAAVRELTADPDSALHMSIAGGRKTMGFLAGYALTLFGRPQDRLSHVLVTRSIESDEHFFYPGPAAADRRESGITLAEIPFVSLRHGLPDLLLRGEASYNDTVEAARRSVGPAELAIDLGRRTVTLYGSSCPLPDAQLALLMVFVTRALDGQPPVCAPNKEVPDEEWSAAYLHELRKLAGTLDDIDETEKALRAGMDGRYFSATLSRLRHYLKTRLKNPRAADIIFDGGRRPRRYALAVPAASIRLTG